ncbi:FAM86A [Emericellopsis cladophorae]|uniref:FAM86A n=1 Tax=Emericellopsis cladophorae TaxID=2686198 RepID=A0A9P9Y5X0_9HYPO|nr:FAM86A [Emericellopsis cladophorae]KAI6784076.1 FAM86A [Emericellopsis cladophorae]
MMHREAITSVNSCIMDNDASDQVDRFCRQYLQLEKTLDFPERIHLRQSTVQEAIYDNLFADEALRCGPPIRYQVKTLKSIVSKIEDSIEDWDQHEVSENLMSALSVLLASPLPAEAEAVQQKCYVTYHLSALARQPCPRVTLLENRSLISAAGTTGLRTWEAALHMSHFLSQRPEIVMGKRVLELGAGTGYLSIVCASFLQATHVVASDGSDDVINNLPENLFLNGLEGADAVTAMDLKWGHALLGTEEAAWNGGRSVDVVLGADVTYDRSVIPALVGTVDDLLQMHPHAEVYVAATERNADTFGAFLSVCQSNGLAVDDLEVEVPARGQQKGPFYNDQVAIRICKISK